MRRDIQGYDFARVVPSRTPALGLGRMSRPFFPRVQVLPRFSPLRCNEAVRDPIGFSYAGLFSDLVPPLGGLTSPPFASRKLDEIL